MNLQGRDRIVWRASTRADRDEPPLNPPEVARFYSSLTIQPFDRIGAVFLPCDSRISEYH